MTTELVGKFAGNKARTIFGGNLPGAWPAVVTAIVVNLLETPSDTTTPKRGP